MSAEVLVGGQFGSEGKGKVAAYLAPEHAMAIRTGGPNAGHTIENNGTVFKLQSVPCSFVNRDTVVAIGAGGFIDLDILQREIRETGLQPGRLLVDPQAGIIEPQHSQSEKDLMKKIGSTGKGVGRAIAAKVLREGDFRLARDIPEIEVYLGDVAGEANRYIDEGKKVFLEGTQGFGLSLHHGIYPFVTGRDITAGSIAADAGLSPRVVEDVTMVLRTYPIRVAGNSGPLANEVDWETVTKESGYKEPLVERTTVTKNIRRVGRFDPDLVQRSVMINRPSQLALMFADYLDHTDRGKTVFEDLSSKTKSFVGELELETGVPVTLIGTGPKNRDMLDLRRQKLGR
jgi:adenylosuccinate synthase